MQRIDFLGANGIGKSTVYAHLLDRRSLSPDWLTLKEARRTVAVDEFVDGDSLKELAKAASCFIPGVGTLFSHIYTTRAAERAFARRGECYQAFYEHCMRHLLGFEPTRRPSRLRHHRPSTSTSTATPTPFTGVKALERHALEAPGPMSAPPVRPAARQGPTPTQYVSLSWIFGRLKELCLLETLDDTVIFDESLTHAMTGLLADTSSDVTVRAHFEQLPLPDAVIYLSASEGEVLRRIRLRRQQQTGPIVRHDHLDADQLRQQARRTLRIAELAASTLAWRGSDVLHLDATTSPEENAERIEAFLSEQ